MVKMIIDLLYAQFKHKKWLISLIYSNKKFHHK